MRTAPFFAFVLLLALPVAAAAQVQKGRIALIEVIGSKRYAPEQIAAVSGLHAGDVVTKEDLQAAADRLTQLGIFTDVRFRYDSLGDNLHLRFLVTDAPAIPVSFDNFPWFTDAELTAAIKQTVVLFDGTAPEQGTILDVITETLQKLLPTRGVTGTIEHTLMAEPGSDAWMQQFHLAGSSLTVESIEWSDKLTAESQRVRERLSDLIGKPYSRFAIEVFAHEQVRPAYLERGHLRVQFGKPTARFTGDPNKPLKSSVLVIVPIEPGPAYTWAGVAWLGNAAFGPRALDEFLTLKPGDLADGTKIARTWQRVEDEYARRGYVDAKVAAQPFFDNSANRVSYRVEITEGLVYRMGELVLTGLSVAAERKAIEAWHISKGQTFDRVYFDEFLATGLKQAFGDLPVHYNDVGHWLRTNPQTRTVDVLLDFR